MLTKLMLPADILTFLPGLLVLVLDSRASSEMCMFSTHKQNILGEESFIHLFTQSLSPSLLPPSHSSLLLPKKGQQNVHAKEKISVESIAYVPIFPH